MPPLFFTAVPSLPLPPQPGQAKRGPQQRAYLLLTLTLAGASGALEPEGIAGRKAGQVVGRGQVSTWFPSVPAL